MATGKIAQVKDGLKMMTGEAEDVVALYLRSDVRPEELAKMQRAVANIERERGIRVLKERVTEGSPGRHTELQILEYVASKGEQWGLLGLASKANSCPNCREAILNSRFTRWFIKPCL